MKWNRQHLPNFCCSLLIITVFVICSFLKLDFSFRIDLDMENILKNSFSNQDFQYLLKYPQYTYRQEGSGAQYPRKRVMAHRRIGKGVREWKGRRNMIWMCPITVNGAADAAHPEIGHNIHVFGPRSMTLRSSPSRNPTHKSSSHNISTPHPSFFPTSPPRRGEFYLVAVPVRQTLSPQLS